MAGSFKIFISYRRSDGFNTARLIYDRLRLDGYSAFFDMEGLENGNFDMELEKKVKKCKDYILVLSPDIFERFTELDYDAKDDWVRQEIACALKSNKNIVPLALEGFAYPKRLPNDIKDITRKNSIDLNPKHFDSAYEKMKSFLVSKPYWKVRHKKNIRFFVSMIVLAIVAYLSFMAFKTYMHTKETEITANSTIAIKDVEIARLRDSVNFVLEAETKRLKDSINSVKDAEIAAIRDSMEIYRELVKEKLITGQPPKAAATTAQKTTTTATAAKKTTAQTKSSTTKKSTKGAK